MLQINLLPLKIRQERVARLRSIFLFCGIGAVLLSLGGVYFQQQKAYSQIRKEIAKVEVDLNSADLIDKVKLVNAIQEREKNVKSKIAVLNAIHDDQAAWLTFLDDLSDRMLPEIWLTGIKKGTSKDAAAKGKIIEIDGMSLNKENALSLEKNLKQSPYFKNAVLQSIAEKQFNQAYVYSFKIICEVKIALYPDL